MRRWSGEARRPGEGSLSGRRRAPRRQFSLRSELPRHRAHGKPRHHPNHLERGPDGRTEEGALQGHRRRAGEVARHPAAGRTYQPRRGEEGKLVLRQRRRPVCGLLARTGKERLVSGVERAAKTPPGQILIDYNYEMTCFVYKPCVAGGPGVNRARPLWAHHFFLCLRASAGV